MKLSALVWIAVIVSLATPFATLAHSWYPAECCSGTDCSLVTNSRQEPGGKWITSAHGTAFVPTGFPTQVSRDNDAHVCMRPDGRNPGKMTVLCYFEPGSS